ncbi:MAG TPA: exostosin family protein [Candidatus Methylacidiphilales bacterium]|nr:exostosin family protein [Candidatus Methylacidiphilales bacterium]
MNPSSSLRVLFDQRCEAPFRQVFGHPLFETVTSGDEADAILFEKDDYPHIRDSSLYARWPEKCLTITEEDVPGFFLPGIYANNRRHFLSRGRTQTYNYFVAQRFFHNPKFEPERQSAPAKQYLVAFVGGSTSWLRKRLFRLAPTLIANDVLIRCTNNYYHWDTSESHRPLKERMRDEYTEILARSSFFLCPRGVGASGGIRLFETMQMGVCPIIIADTYILPNGPDWPQFALLVSEAELPRLIEIARRHVSEAQARGQRAREAWEAYFSEAQHAPMLARLIRELLVQRDSSRERRIRFIYPFYHAWVKTRERLRAFARNSILGFFRLVKFRFPYQLNRSDDKGKG